MVACALAAVQPAAALAPCGRRSLSGHLRRLPSPRLSGRIRISRSVVAKVAKDSSESSGSVVRYVKSSFSTAEDIFALAGISFGAVAALWASINLVEVIDKLPVLPLFFELIGIVVAWARASGEHQKHSISNLGPVTFERNSGQQHCVMDIWALCRPGEMQCLTVCI
ncbi:hypothetical protein PVAP13_5NG507500 [Panicum virgatum]|uniref:Cyanobacterial aminoacyl-tRNA synthetase CAAD domain-containing protein n=1 Tax=Panicum virgatum TaxID=38727 RepID=A0A8T0RZI9_PANVG|nr:hypothetical protein PVAP13_5NG507500 [Panicum virgatum]